MEDDCGEGLDGSQSHFLDVETNESMLEKKLRRKTGEPDEQNPAAEHAIDIKRCAEEEHEKIEKIILVDEGQGQGRGSNQLVLKDEEEELDEESELIFQQL
ncbi:hypothetical protein SESBI_04799 [Sesbania bispinosa]|nr:hypothetical protein SESBI_04799 [Sesbania bispinosa]